MFFTERNAPVLLVIDSLDEAPGSGGRLRQADILALPWRIVLTSRPSSWNNQLVIEEGNDSHRVGELQPLRYPDDVEPFIERWFAGRPDRGKDLAAQIARRPGLQRAATVPLILAFYCIVGDTGPLPDFRRDLYTRVLNRLLTSRWRHDDDRRGPDEDTCLQTLRAWASSDPVSGVGTWTDDISTERVRLGEADADALDHVATPLGPPDVDTWKTPRRFIHRSIREHLVAEHVVRLSVDDAVAAGPALVLRRRVEELPRPDLPIVVGLDGGYVHSSQQRSRTDGWFEVIAGKAIPTAGRASCFGYVQTYGTKPKRRLFEVLQSQGMAATSRSPSSPTAAKTSATCRCTSTPRPSTCWTGST